MGSQVGFVKPGGEFCGLALGARGLGRGSAALSLWFGSAASERRTPGGATAELREQLPGSAPRSAGWRSAGLLHLHLRWP